MPEKLTSETLSQKALDSAVVDGIAEELAADSGPRVFLRGKAFVDLRGSDDG